MDSLHHNATLALGNMKLFLSFSSFKNLLICKILLVLLIISFYQFIENLAFLQAAMTNSRQHRIPVTKSIFTHHCLKILRFCIRSNFKSLGFCILGKHLLTLQDIIFLQFLFVTSFTFKPLINLVFRLSTLDQFQPVTAGSLGIL